MLNGAYSRLNGFSWSESWQKLDTFTKLLRQFKTHLNIELLLKESATEEKESNLKGEERLFFSTSF